MGPMYEARKQRLRDVLARCNDPRSVATVTIFTISHSRLVLRIRTARDETETLICLSCTRVAMTPRWTGVALDYFEQSDEVQVLRDESAGFHLECSVIIAGEDEEGVDLPISDE